MFGEDNGRDPELRRDESGPCLLLVYVLHKGFLP